MGFRTIIVLQQIIEFLSTLGGHFEPIPIPFYNKIKANCEQSLSGAPIITLKTLFNHQSMHAQPSGIPIQERIEQTETRQPGMFQYFSPHVHLRTSKGCRM